MVTTIEEYYKPVKQKFKSLGIEGICLDIDDTLSATNFFWAQNHISNFGNPEDLTAQEIIRKYRYVSNVPYWNNNEAAEKWILQHHQSSEGKLQLLPVKNAVEAIKKIRGIVTLSAYLTGRPQSTVESTKKWLEKYDFPQLNIIVQPSPIILEEMCLSDGNQWKARVLEYLYPQVNAMIDDNIGLVDYLSSSYRGTIYLFSHKGPINVPLNVICCPKWKDIVETIKNNK